MEFAEWRGQGRPPVQGVSLSIGGAGAVMTDSSKRAALPQAGVGAVVPLAAARDQGIRKSQSLSMSSAPVHALASPIKRCRKISAFINVLRRNQRGTHRRPVSPGNLSFYQCFTAQPEGNAPRRPVSPGNLSFYHCFTAQPEANAPPPSQSRKSQLLSMFYHATRGESPPPSQSRKISIFINVSSRLAHFPPPGVSLPKLSIQAK